MMNLETQKLRNLGTPRSGFTIVELLMVVGIISVLVTITISSVSGSIKRSRSQRANALCTLAEQGIATYYAQKDEWPVKALNNDNLKPNADASGNRNVSSDAKIAYALDGSEVKEAMETVIKQIKDGNPMIDVSGLFVCVPKGSSAGVGEGNYRGNGMDFMTAVLGTKRNQKKAKLSQMYFGYPDPETGHFRRFKMVYSPDTDRLKVSMQ